MSFDKFHPSLNAKSELLSGRIQRASAPDIVNPLEEEEEEEEEEQDACHGSF